jgi:cytochrome c-type biogenesis protein CcmH
VTSARAARRPRPRRAARRRICIVLVAVLAAAATSPIPSATLAATPQSRPVLARTTLPTIEREVMCVTCKIPLEIAESPQADRERAFIVGLIAHGKTEAQIKRALVGQYGPTVLALPAEHGLDLAAYLVPLAVVLALLVTLLLLLPSWRRRGRAQSLSAAGAGAPLDAPLEGPDAARLNADLARFE